MPTALGSVLWQRRHLGSWALAFLPLVFPAKAGTQGPRSTGRQPKGHRAAKGSAARRVLFFKRAQAPRRRSAYCAEVRSVAAGPPRPLDPRFPTPRFPGEGRDPGTTEHWTATKRTSSRQGLCGTEGAFFLKEPEHRAGEVPSALRSVLWQRGHRGPWASRFPTPSFSRRTPGPRDHGALDGGQKDIGAPEGSAARRVLSF